QVPAGVRTGALSGGQQQRLAIARTLAYDPDVILYDEPTSGLDAATAAQAADLIKRTHDAHGKTSIIVTHDYEALAPIADAVYLVDPRLEALVRVEPAEWPNLRQQLNPADLREDVEEPASGRQRPLAWPHSAAAALEQALIATSRMTEAALHAPRALVPLWHSPRWGLRFFLHYLRLVAGPSAWVYVAVAGMIIGFVATHFTFRFLPYAQYTEPLLTEDLLATIGFALYRILVPVLATILIAARCGAAVASDVGGKMHSRQMDALRTFGVSPPRYLLTNVLYAFLLGTPVLTAVSFVTAKWTSLVVFTATHSDRGPEFWRLHFHRRLHVPGEFFYDGSE
ncbi:MAG: ABC transporter permease, partial [Planctomycetaceae bacterium]